MYPPPILYYNSLNSSLNSYDRYKMDIIMSYYLQGKFNKTIELKQPTKDIYKSPKRDNICPRCGQQYHWCSCHLNNKQL